MTNIIVSRFAPSFGRWLPALLLALLVPLGPALAETASVPVLDASRSKEISTSLDTIERSLSRQPSLGNLNEWFRQVTQSKSKANLCVSTAEQQQTDIVANLTTLGAEVQGEDVAVTRKRTALLRDKTALEKQLSSCRLLVLRSDELLTAISAAEQELLARHLLARGPAITAVLQENWKKPSAWWEGTREFIASHSGIKDLTQSNWFALAGSVSVGGLFGLWLRRRICRSLGDAPSGFAGAFRRSLLVVTARFSPHLLVTTAVAGLVWAFSHEQSTVPFIGLVAYGLPVYFLLALLIQLFLAPPPPAVAYLPLEEAGARALARRLQVLALLVYVGYLLFSTLLWQSLPEPAVLLARAVFAGALVLNMIWVFWLMSRISPAEDLNWVRAGMSLLLVVMVAAEWLGYRNLSLYLLRGVLGTMVSIGFSLLLSRLFRELYEGLDSGARGWYREARRLLGLSVGAPFPGLTWLRFLTTVSIWAATALAILTVWGISQGAIEYLRTFMVDGFAVGSLQIVPSRILLALFVLALLLPTSRWLRTRLEKRWLKKTYLDRGAREALVTISGYSVIGTAVMLALGIAGVDFANLALIAGALSVGIGFGLQNIVNNFVSGLILLFERPVKTGDWIVVGQTEGYVRRISIRSTQIQTFDRADVIVPNSELIANQVTNWMLRDQFGRVIVPVGVAYGSDTNRVKELLLEVARNHPDVVLDDPRLSRPSVLFRRFGDSSLDFELRCFIYNVDDRMRVISDLNFAIDAAFREHGIEIPFPQRDLRIKEWPGCGGKGPASEPAG